MNTQLMSEDERINLQAAIEIMVTFDIKLLSTPFDPHSNPNIACFTPDISQLVNFGKGNN